MDGRKLESASASFAMATVINSFFKGQDIKIIEPIINKKISIIWVIYVMWNKPLQINFSYRITSIILLFTAFLNYNTLLTFDIVIGIGIYNGLFHITYIKS